MELTVDGEEVIPGNPESHVWDVIVIGTGAGGATAGFNLARLGRSVLFLERGRLLGRDPDVVRGVPFAPSGDAEEALRHGWWPGSVYRRVDGYDTPVKTPFGSGAGGSTALFGAVMDRFRPSDFTPRRYFPDAPDTSLPEAWPITYAELEPFYDQAESLYRVRGTPDPLLPVAGGVLAPPPSSPRELAVIAALGRAGLHPYRLHAASERAPGCLGCAAVLCSRTCRNDAGRICLVPALENHGAKILPGCRVVRLEERGGQVQQAVCDMNGRRVAVRGRVFVLAANAYLTPVILQRSASLRFPDGLANSSGLVGRNLMLHATNQLMLRLKGAARFVGSDLNQGVSLNDFYVRNGTKLGNIQGHPIATTRDAVLSYLRQYGGQLSYLRGPVLSAIAAVGWSWHRSSMWFAQLIEDLPYVENRVIARPGSDEDVVYEYTYPDELQRRSQAIFDDFKAAVAADFSIRPLHPVGSLNGSHVCGTCRFGDDPKTSVLDRDNRAHDLDNLYVVDASFFPSSGGINPSLTIAANSLRVSEKIARRV